ncbi:MAG: glycosyltransferase [Helicobacteraceae bacterium]|jgi:UDP-N-acetylglucosamine--N-acetylmuramyl-(pentapeptide) pyrophosphoryl-undecaprenol N-acetylglucosamine transferase|nr:glycosyltransferase [Helicobacteraceae bacterium]
MIVLSGGGTGGHLAVVSAVKEVLNAKGFKPFFIGSDYGQDRAWFGRDSGFVDKAFLPSRGVMNRKGLGKLFSLVNNGRLVISARKSLSALGVKTVFCAGGYAAAPAALAAISLKIPLVIHEQNAVSGALNRRLKPFCKAFYSSFDPISPCGDYPIKRVFFEKARVRSKIKTIIFLGGSQGSEAINKFAESVAPSLAERGVKIIHQCGRVGFENMRKFYEENGIVAEVFDFDFNLVDRLVEADFAVARSGAGTMFELTANGLPALFVPYPFAVGNHQMANAKRLSERELGWCVEEARLSPEVLDNILPVDLSDISKRLAKEIRYGGAHAIAERLLILRKTT